MNEYYWTEWDLISKQHNTDTALPGLSSQEVAIDTRTPFNRRLPGLLNTLTDRLIPNVSPWPAVQLFSGDKDRGAVAFEQFCKARPHSILSVGAFVSTTESRSIVQKVDNLQRVICRNAFVAVGVQKWWGNTGGIWQVTVVASIIQIVDNQ